MDEVAAALLGHINAGRTEALFAMFSAEMQKALPLEATQAFVQGVVAAKGKLVSKQRMPGETGANTAKFLFEAERGSWLVRLHVDAQKQIRGLALDDPPEPEPPVARSDIALSLPFDGEWFVFWGGSVLEHNQHVTHASQRRAADLVMRTPEGRTHRGDGKKNEDYPAYGQPILAVADGEVVTVIDGIPDSVPGKLNPYFAGNLVIIRHTETLYSAYAHLQPGKMRVKPGMRVKRRAPIGLCGNSGHSSEPHLHFQLQDGPRFEQSWGVEAVFQDVHVVRDGQAGARSDYTFLRGDLISPASAVKASSGAR